MKTIGITIIAFCIGLFTYAYWPTKNKNICFDYNLTINQDISEDTKKAIKDSLNEATAKIAEACALVEQSK